MKTLLCSDCVNRYIHTLYTKNLLNKGHLESVLYSDVSLIRSLSCYSRGCSVNVDNTVCVCVHAVVIGSIVLVPGVHYGRVFIIRPFSEVSHDTIYIAVGYF